MQKQGWQAPKSCIERLLLLQISLQRKKLEFNGEEVDEQPGDFRVAFQELEELTSKGAVGNN